MWYIENTNAENFLIRKQKTYQYLACHHMKTRWSLYYHLQHCKAKHWNSKKHWYSDSLNYIMLVETTHLSQVESPTISLADVRSFTFVTGRMPRSGKLPVLNLVTGQKSRFSPCRGDSLHRFTSNLAGTTDTWVHLAAQNFTSIAPGGWECGPKNIKNFHFS